MTDWRTAQREEFYSSSSEEEIDGLIATYHREFEQLAVALLDTAPLTDDDSELAELTEEEDHARWEAIVDILNCATKLGICLILEEQREEAEDVDETEAPG